MQMALGPETWLLDSFEMRRLQADMIVPPQRDIYCMGSPGKETRLHELVMDMLASGLSTLSLWNPPTNNIS